jgi:hypothetical protein
MFDPTLTTWRAQFQRLKRTFDKVCGAYRSSIEYEDDLHHFFQDCWHLKDWIKNDPTTSASKTIEHEVDAEQALRIAADLANGGKHLARTTHRVGAYVTSSSVTVHLGQNKPIDTVYTVTLEDGSTCTAEALVTECFEAWSRVLSRLGLVP